VTKIGGISHQVGVFLASLSGFFVFLLAAEFLAKASPPLLVSHHYCELASEFACGFGNVAFFSLSGIVGGTAGAIVAWRANRALIPIVVALLGGSLFVVISTLGGQSILSMPIFTNYAGWPSWLTVPFPIVLAGLAMFFLVRRVIKA